MSYYNIESRRFPGHDYLVGYRKSDGMATRIHKFRHGWRVGFFEFRSLSEVSAYLETI